MSNGQVVSHLLLCIAAWKSKQASLRAAQVAITVEAPEIMAHFLNRIPAGTLSESVEIHNLLKACRSPKLHQHGSQQASQPGPGREAMGTWLRSGLAMELIGPHFIAAVRQTIALYDRLKIGANIDVRPLSDLLLNLKKFSCKAANPDVVDAADATVERIALFVQANAPPDGPPTTTAITTIIQKPPKPFSPRLAEVLEQHDKTVASRPRLAGDLDAIYAHVKEHLGTNYTLGTWRRYLREARQRLSAE